MSRTWLGSILSPVAVTSGRGRAMGPLRRIMPGNVGWGRNAQIARLLACALVITRMGQTLSIVSDANSGIATG